MCGVLFNELNPFHFAKTRDKTFKFSNFGYLLTLEIVFTTAAPAFHTLFMVMGCVFDITTVHKTVEKLTFQAFY